VVTQVVAQVVVQVAAVVAVAEGRDSRAMAMVGQKHSLVVSLAS